MTSMPPPWDPDEGETEETRALPRARPREETAETRALAPRVEPTSPRARRPSAVPPPRRDRELWPWLLLLLGLVAGLLAALWYVSRDDDGADAAATRPVPSVLRLDVADARDVLTDQGFVVEVLRRATDEAPRNVVFRQRPAPGTRLEDGGTVRITVSLGPATETVPDVVGLGEAEARQALAGAGLEPTIRRVPSDAEEGTVVAQAPKAGAQVDRGSDVRLNVSGGPGTVTVPDVVGAAAEAAAASLADVGLRAETEDVPSAEPEGTVVEQDPAAGSEVRRGATVRLSVSTGAPERVGVPDVAGLSADEARARLESLGFRVRVVEEPAADPAQAGTVVRQVPAAGRDVPPGTLVTIVVGT